MTPLTAYQVAISVSEYQYSTVLGVTQLEDAVNKLCHRVFRLTDEESSFFDLSHFLAEVNELDKDESICFQISKSRPFTLNVKRII